MASNHNRWINYLTGQYNQNAAKSYSEFQSSSWIKAHSPPQDQQNKELSMQIDESDEISGHRKRKSIDMSNVHEIDSRKKKIFRH